MTLTEPLSGLTDRPSIPEAQSFDYGSLDSETRIVVQQRTREIKSLMRQTAQDIIDIGQKLTEVKQQLGHGNFRSWLNAEFEWGIWTATKFMQVADRFKCVNFTHLEIAASALYRLAAPSTPEDAREEALERASLGEAISHSKANAIVSQHKGAAKSKAPKPITSDAPVQTVVRDSSTPSEQHPASQTLELQGAAVVEQSEDKLSEKKTEALAYSQVSNLFHDIAPDTDSGDYSLKNQTEIDIQSSSLIGNLIYLTDRGQQESKLLGQVAEVKEATATDIVIRISVQPSIRANASYFLQ